MAVSQDLPAIYNFAQFKASKNSEVFDASGEPIGTLTSNQNKILLTSGQISPNIKNAVVSIEDCTLLRTHRRRLPGHRPGADQRHPQPERRSGRLDDHRAVRQERARRRRAAARSSRSSARRPWPTGWSATGARTKSSPSTSTRSTSARAPTGSRPPPAPTSARRTPAAAPPTEPCAAVLEPWEAATLAAIIASPSAYDPKIYPENALMRRNIVLEKMYEQGYITRPSSKKAPSRPCRRPATSSRRSSTRRPPTSPPGCASSWSTATAPRKPSSAA